MEFDEYDEDVELAEDAEFDALLKDMEIDIEETDDLEFLNYDIGGEG